MVQPGGAAAASSAASESCSCFLQTEQNATLIEWVPLNPKVLSVTDVSSTYAAGFWWQIEH